MQLILEEVKLRQRCCHIAVPPTAICTREKQLAQDFYASFCASVFDPVRNPYKIECIIDSKLTVLMMRCAKHPLARPCQRVGYARPTAGVPTERSATCLP